MRPFLVELLREIVEPGLLLETVHARRPGGLLLEREMHPLVAAVLLGMAGLDAFDGDSQSEPPDGKLREVEQAIGVGEGDAIVGADRRGQAALLEEVLEGSDGKILAS